MRRTKHVEKRGIIDTQYALAIFSVSHVLHDRAKSGPYVYTRPGVITFTSDGRGFPFSLTKQPVDTLSQAFPISTSNLFLVFVCQLFCIIAWI